MEDWLHLSNEWTLEIDSLLCSPMGEAYILSCGFVRLSGLLLSLVRHIALKLLMGFKWNLVIGRWQWEERQHTKKYIILPCIYISRVISFYSFIMDGCLGHIFESTKWIEMKLGTHIWFIPYILLEFYFLFFTKGCFLCHILVYKWFWITSSAFYRQLPFGEHSSFPAILFVIIVTIIIDILVFSFKIQLKTWAYSASPQNPSEIL